MVSKAKEVNGIIIAVPQESYYNITTLGVYKEYRGMKIGAELLNKMSHQLSILGEAYVTLDVHSLNYSALNLYNKYGFKIKV
jgi:ribosomal protein S18 acetylase RimI-like enzyme